MKRSQDLSHDQLAAIVDRLQAVLYLDRGEGGDGRPFWNLDKEWQSVDMLLELADVLQQFDLIPRVRPEST